MKKLDRLILTSFLGPLVLTFTLADFVLLMQFLWKYIDDLVGKGLDILIVLQLLLYASATFVPMALPIATLFACIMTMGNFGEKYELVAMKAAGISLRRIMMPLAFASIVLVFVAFFFTNWVMPYANLKFKSLRSDIIKTKPALNIRPNEYYSGIDGYVIRVNGKSSDGKKLENIIIYDHTHGNQNNITVAQEGSMVISPDQRYLTFHLSKGYNYTEEIGGNKPDFPLTRIYFDEQSKRFDLSSFAFAKNESEDMYKNHYEMMNLKQLQKASDTFKIQLDMKLDNIAQAIQRTLPYYNSLYVDATAKDQQNLKDTALSFYAYWDTLPKAKKEIAYKNATDFARSGKYEIESQKEITNIDMTTYRRHLIEMQRKFSLPIACFIFFIVGAPFGSIVRKGGLGAPLVASTLCFIVYYVVGMIAERATRSGSLPVEIGMWLANMVFLPIGIYLTYKATADAPVLDAENWKKLFDRFLSLFRKKNQSTEKIN